MNAQIETKDGTVEINHELLAGYLSESCRHYAAIEAAKTDLKLIGESLEEKTGIKASMIMKWVKSRYDEKTKEATELGELFQQLDEAIEG